MSKHKGFWFYITLHTRTQFGYPIISTYLLQVPCIHYLKKLIKPFLNVLVNISFLLPEIEPEFREQLQVLVPMVLAPENIVIKIINGSKITANELVQYFKVCTLHLDCSVGKVMDLRSNGLRFSYQCNFFLYFFT